MAAVSEQGDKAAMPSATPDPVADLARARHGRALIRSARVQSYRLYLPSTKPAACGEDSDGGSDGEWCEEGADGDDDWLDTLDDGVLQVGVTFRQRLVRSKRRMQHFAQSFVSNATGVATGTLRVARCALAALCSVLHGRAQCSFGQLIPHSPCAAVVAVAVGWLRDLVMLAVHDVMHRRGVVWCRVCSRTGQGRPRVQRCQVVRGKRGHDSNAGCQWPRLVGLVAGILGDPK